jgi:hypothetical protein
MLKRIPGARIGPGIISARADGPALTSLDGEEGRNRPLQFCSRYVLLHLPIELRDIFADRLAIALAEGSKMLLENFQIGRLIVHEIFQRTDRNPQPPIYGAALEILSPEAAGVFKLRVTEALSAKAKSLEMQIAKFGADSFLHLVAKLLAATDPDFVTLSRQVADRLVAAQLARGLPGGMLLVFDGEVGVPAAKFVGVIKAEIQSGFRRGNATSLIEFLNNVFLTPATRLYKIGLMVRTDPFATPPDGWKTLVFDSNIAQNHREAAAQYFFEAFLGCALPADGAYETGRFFDLTKEFVRGAELPSNKKRDVVDALYTFVKTDQARTFTSKEFGERYLPAPMRDDFENFLSARRFPSRAIVRDTSEMGNRLRRRRFRFGPEIEFSISPEALDEKMAVIKDGKASDFGGDGNDRWTQITIHKQITDER